MLAALLLPCLLSAGTTHATAASRKAATEPWLLAALEARLSRLTSDQLALSPDGEKLAYTFREGPDLFLLIAACSEPTKVLTQVRIGTEDSSQHIGRPLKIDDGRFMGRRLPQPIPYKGKTAPVAHRLLWAGNRHLVVVTNLNVPTISAGLNYSNRHGGLFVVNADGTGGRLLTTSTDIHRRFDKGTFFTDLVLADETHGLVRLNAEEALQIGLLDGKLKRVPLADHTRASEAVRAEEKRRQQLALPHVRGLEREFPEDKIDLLGADQSVRLLALRKQSPIDAGSLCVLVPAGQKLLEVARCQPETDPGQYLVERRRLVDDEGIEHESVQLRRKLPLPGRGGLIVVCGDKPTAPVPRAYDPRLMCLVEMGYTVLQAGDLQLPGKPSKAEQLREVLRLLPQEGLRDQRGRPLPPAPRALLGLGKEGNELAYLALYHQEESWDAGIFLRPSISSTGLLGPYAELLGPEWGERQHPSTKTNRQALCLYEDGTDTARREKLLQWAMELFGPLEKNGTLVTYTPETWAARVLQHDEELVPLYEEIGHFLHGALVRARVELGKPEVVQEPAKE